jgi:hypothetical protein
MDDRGGGAAAVAVLNVARWRSCVMFDSQCDLAALVYEQDQDPDKILHDFASDLNASGYRAVGLVQLGHHCLDAPKLSAMLVHTGEELQLFQNLGACATGCRLDVGQLLDAGTQVASAIDQGADLVIVNRFGRQEREGKGLSFLVERALSADIPVVIAVPSHRFADWIRFAEGMSVKLRCDRAALDAWWQTVSAATPGSSGRTIGRSAKFSSKPAAGQISKRFLLVAAFLAGEFHPRRALGRRDAVWRAAFSAGGLDAGVALLHHNDFAFHGFADQAFGLFAHRLLRHPLYLS